MNIPSLHRQFAKQLINLATRFRKWLENRREDFEAQRDSYEQALNQVGVQSRLRIPFDEKNPQESYNALVETVHQYLVAFLPDLNQRLNQVQQKIRYAQQVQQADLADVRVMAENLLERLATVQGRLSANLLREMSRAEAEILKPLNEIVAGEKAAANAVQEVLGKRSPNEQEGALLRSLHSLANSNEVDLYSLIVSRLEQSDDTFDLGRVMDDLQSLFQKNQIGLRIRLL